MNPSWTPADVTRVLDLIAAPLALEILDALGHDGTLEVVVSETATPAAMAEAIARLRDLGAVTALDPERQVYELTPCGHRLLTALEQVSAAIEADQLDR
jgi:DNA-binding transcriptional ArsR family regulator